MKFKKVGGSTANGGTWTERQEAKEAVESAFERLA
jgi:hypothetical protein